MRVRRIDQVVPSLASRDAIGGHVLQLQELLVGRGFESDIYYGTATPDRLGHGLPMARIGERPETGRALLYQLSIGSGVADVFRQRPERKLVNYHNITPAPLLDPWLPEVGDEVRWGRAQMAALAGVTELAVADSRFNERELQVAGYRATATVPLLLDLASFAGAADPATAERLRRERSGGGTTMLFVGKVAPHKAQHDLVKALAAYRRVYDPRARLKVVGGAISEEYRRAVLSFADALGLGDALELAGSVTHEELVAYYEAADVFVCLSDHEGFCVPLVEAMTHRVPIVGTQSTAVPETIGEAGLVLRDKSPLRVATAVHRVVSDPYLRERLAAGAAARVEAFSLERVRLRMAEVLDAALSA